MPPNPDGLKHAIISQAKAGKPIDQYLRALAWAIGEVEAKKFLAGGWQYSNGQLPEKVDKVGQQIQNRVKIKPRLPCLYELGIIERCACPNLTEAQAALRHVYECGHDEQDGVACTRGANNGTAIWCAKCHLYEPKNSEQV